MRQQAKRLLKDVFDFFAYWNTVKFTTKPFYFCTLAGWMLAMAGFFAPWTDTASFNSRLYQEAILDILPLGVYQILWGIVFFGMTLALLFRNYLAFLLSSVLLTAVAVSYTWTILWAKLTTDIQVSWVAVALWNSVVYYGFACILLDEKAN